jgi:hypothetical protein
MATIALLLLMLSPLSGQSRAGEQCDYGLSTCEAYETADAVFIGKVVRIVPDTFTMRQFEEGYDQTAYVEIEKVYKGYKGRTIVLKQLKHAQKFIYGSTYLFYADFDRSRKHWEVMPCGRTRMAQYAQEDLRFLDKLPTHAGKTRIAGEVVRLYKDPDMGKTLERVAGMRIKIIGKDKEYDVTTDEKGTYELYDVPPGKYLLEPRPPQGLAFSMAIHNGADPVARARSLEIELEEHGCSGATIILEPVKEQIGAGSVRPEPLKKMWRRGAGGSVLR